MALSTYTDLQTAVLDWLARPGDPLVAPFVPDMITLFEREARRRLRVGDAEVRAYMTVNGTAAVALPTDCRELRLVTSGGQPLEYVTPHELPGGAGPPFKYTLHGGNQLQLGPGPSGATTIEILYQIGVPPLSDAQPTNWLLTEHPDVYLYGTLANATAFIGHDERIPLWLQGREAAFASIEQADRKARWAGQLTIRPDIYGAPMANAWTIVPPALLSGVDVVGSGPLPAGAAGDINIRNATGALITIALPANPTIGQALRFKDILGNASSAPIMITGASIDGAPNYVIFNDHGAVELYWSGSNWSVR